MSQSEVWQCHLCVRIQKRHSQFSACTQFWVNGHLIFISPADPMGIRYWYISLGKTQMGSTKTFGSALILLEQDQLTPFDKSRAWAWWHKGPEDHWAAVQAPIPLTIFSQWNFVMLWFKIWSTVTLSWCVQNFLVIGWALQILIEFRIQSKYR